MKNEKIIDAWNKIEPDEETKQKIFGDILKKQHKKRPKFKRLAVIAAVMAVLLVLTSAAVVVVLNEVVYYDINGNKRLNNWDSYDLRYMPESDEWKFMIELCENKEDNEIIISVTPEELFKPLSSIHQAYKTIEDYDELKEYLQNHGGEEFKLPGYLPERFEFDYSKVYITLSADSDYENLEQVYYEEKFGNIYEKYILPENQIRIQAVVVIYTDGKMQISFSIHFMGGDIDRMVFGTTLEIKKEPEVIDIPQFDRSLIISYKNGLFTDMWDIKAIKIMDEPVNIFDANIISKTYRELQNDTFIKNFKINEYSSIYYNIMASSIPFSSVSREEMIKMAESIK